MEQIIKAGVTVFCLLVVTFAATGLIVSSVNASKADKFISDCAIAIEQGNFQSGVISSMQTEAEANDYTLTCSPKDTDGDGYTDMVDLKLEYDYTIPFLNTESKNHVLTAYAR